MDGNASFLRSARSGNVEKVLEHLKGSIDINTSNAVSFKKKKNIFIEMCRRLASRNISSVAMFFGGQH